MQPEFQDRPAFAVLGVLQRVNPMTADYHDIWLSRFGPREGEIRPFSTDQCHYAVYFCTGQQDQADLLVGMAVEGVESVPEGLTLREVPAAHEAVFPCTLATIGPTWGGIYGQWLAASGYERADGSADYERFPPEFEPGRDALTIHVPVRRK